MATTRRRPRAKRTSGAPAREPVEGQLPLPLFGAIPDASAPDEATVPAEPSGQRRGRVDDFRSQHDRALVARIAAAERWARTADRTAATAPARQGLVAKFEREADPEGLLSSAERGRRADQLMRAHMLRMARRSAQARRSTAQSASG